jgi:catechol 2,3-dioxygenase-like lactoylglutathione lyase family enzyme
MGVLGVFHPTITVSNMEGALTFYRDVLGLRPTFDGLHEPAALSRLLGYAEPEVRAVIVEAPDGTEIELAEFRRPKGRPNVDRDWADAGLSLLSLRVTDIEELMARITHAGFSFTSDLVHQTLPDGAVVKVAVCRGPDGVSVTLSELPSDRTSLSAEG